MKRGGFGIICGRPRGLTVGRLEMGAGPAEWKRQEITGAQPHVPGEQRSERCSDRTGSGADASGPRPGSAQGGGASASDEFSLPKTDAGESKKRSKSPA